MTKIFSDQFLTRFLDPSAKLFFLCARHCRVQHVSTELLYLATYSRETCYFTRTYFTVTFFFHQDLAPLKAIRQF